VEAGLQDLRQAYAELHKELEAGARPAEEQDKIAQHVSTSASSCVPTLVCLSRSKHLL
jgi:hypothetical protein